MLSSSREGGVGGLQPIRITEIEAYFRVTGVDCAPDRVKYLRLIRRMDDTLLSHHAEKAAKTANNKTR